MGGNNIFVLIRDKNNKILWTNEQIELIKKLYLEKEISYSKIAKMFTVSPNTIKKVLLNNNINTTYQYYRNSNIFSVIDTYEKAYWLGMMCADGSVTLTPNALMRLSLHINDLEHLKKFQTFLETNKPIYIYKHNMCELVINDKKIVNDLINLNCIPNKTYYLEFPNLPKQYISSFILGYFDGDGCITYNIGKDGYLRAKFSIIGTLKFLQSLVQHLNILDNKYRIVLAHRCNNTYELIVTGNLRVYTLLRTLYENHKSNVFLERKYKKLLELEQYLVLYKWLPHTVMYE